IDRFDIAWSVRDRVKISNREIGEDRALELEFEFEMFLRRGVDRDAVNDAQQQGTVKNQRNPAQNRQRDQCTTTPVFPSRTRLTTSAHGRLTPLPEAKAQIGRPGEPDCACR